MALGRVGSGHHHACPRARGHTPACRATHARRIVPLLVPAAPAFQKRSRVSEKRSSRRVRSKSQRTPIPMAHASIVPARFWGTMRWPQLGTHRYGGTPQRYPADSRARGSSSMGESGALTGPRFGPHTPKSRAGWISGGRDTLRILHLTACEELRAQKRKYLEGIKDGEDGNAADIGSSPHSALRDDSMYVDARHHPKRGW